MTLPPAGGLPDADWPCALLSTGADGVITDVNDTFVSWTGHRRDDVVGRRRVRDLLTGGGRIMYETHLGPLLAMQGHVSEVALDLRCADGTTLPILLNATTSSAGRPARPGVRFALVVASERRSYERQLLEARRTAEAAVAASERAQRRLSLALEVNTMLSGTLELEIALQRLTAMLARERDGCCVIVTHLDGPLQTWQVTASGENGAGTPLARLGIPLARALRPAAAHPLLPECELTALLVGPRPELVSNLRLPVRDADAERAADPDDRAPDVIELGATVVVPVRARDRQVATILLTRPVASTGYTEEDLLEVATLADRIGLFIDNLRLYGREHDRAVALQRALLTPPARPAGFDIVTRYLPGVDDAMVGGDWYDSFVRADGATVIVIGDVMGHDHLAAAAMGQLRGLLRALAYTACQPPAELLTAVDTAARGLGVAALATVVVVVFDTTDRGAASASWANAGHLPPALITADGHVRLLDNKPDLMLGVEPGLPRHTHVLDWCADSTLLLYTDGLVEDRSRGLHDGLEMLVAALGELAAHRLDVLCDELISMLPAPHRGDDIAVLAIRTGFDRRGSTRSTSPTRNV